MDKREYLIKTFSRTKKKDYENYILTAIWHKLDNINIKPVTQQYIKRKNGTHALMDLYFPQLHVGIEVDEAHHKNNQKADQIRMDDIIAALNEESIDNFKCFRIDATGSIELINNQVNEIVEFIKERSLETTLRWHTYEKELEILKQKNFLSIHDNISFRTIKDITNTIFGKNAKGYQRSYFRVLPEMWIWCPKLSIIEENEMKSVANGWLNFLSNDWKYIDESHQDEDTVEKRKIKDYQNEKFERAVFAKYKNKFGHDTYRFVGIFKIAGVSPENINFIRYVRVADKVKII